MIWRGFLLLIACSLETPASVQPPNGARSGSARDCEPLDARGYSVIGVAPGVATGISTAGVASGADHTGSTTFR